MAGIIVGETASCVGGLGNRSSKSLLSDSPSDSEIVVGSRVEKDTFFLRRRGWGRWIIEGGWESGSDEEGESRMLEAAEETEVCEKMEDTEERMLLDMEALEE